jgi:V-type H+-transporting ATPase subunit e
LYLQKIEKMLSAGVTMGIISLVWLAIGGIGPFLVPKGAYKGVYQTMIVTVAVCCWLHWFLTYMSQLNPLMGPQLTTAQIQFMQWVWE